WELDWPAVSEAGIRSYLVPTGLSGADTVEDFPYRPSQVVVPIADLVVPVCPGGPRPPHPRRPAASTLARRGRHPDGVTGAPARMRAPPSRGRLRVSGGSR